MRGDGPGVAERAAARIREVDGAENGWTWSHPLIMA
jgi:hypothetical protein